MQEHSDPESMICGSFYPLKVALSSFTAEIVSALLRLLYSNCQQNNTMLQIYFKLCFFIYKIRIERRSALIRLAALYNFAILLNTYRITGGDINII